MSRAALLAGAGAVAAAAVVSCGGTYGQCPVALTLESPCGFLLVETSCAGGLPDCTKDPSGLFTSCSVVPKTDKCSVSVMLVDGTQHVVDVTDDKCVVPSFVDFRSSTCTTPVVDAAFPPD